MRGNAKCLVNDLNQVIGWGMGMKKCPLTIIYGILGTRACGLSGAFRQLALAFKLSDMVKQQLYDVFLDAVPSTQGGGSLQFVHEISGDIS